MGGAIYNTGSMNISGGNFTNNTVPDTATANTGGAIYNNNTSIFTVTGSNFLNNSAAVGGGIITFSTTSISYSNFSGNIADTLDGGGAIAYRTQESQLLEH